jgi:epsilon-lactone hydrolase
MSDPTPRQQVEDLFHTMPAEPPSMAALRDAYDAVVAHGELPADLDAREVDAGGIPALAVQAPDTSAERVVVWFHSGGYMVGSVAAYRSFAHRLSRAADAVVLLVDYRLAPEHPFPAAIDDALAAAVWAMGEWPHASVVIGGDSAGAALSLRVLVELRDRGLQPAAGISLSPLADLALTGASITTNAATDVAGSVEGFVGIAETYHPGGDRTDPRASPFYSDFTGIPPLFLAAGSREILLDDATRIAAKITDAGGAVTLEIGDELGHIWPIFFGILPEAEETVERIGAFVRERTAG